MNILITLAMSITLALSGITAPAPMPSTTDTATAAPASAQPSPTVMPTQPVEHSQCEEDQACWDCNTMGNLQCANPDLEDAWNAFDTLDIDLDGPKDNMVIDYVGKRTGVPLGGLPKGQFSVASLTLPNVFYIFQYNVMTNA